MKDIISFEELVKAADVTDLSVNLRGDMHLNYKGRVFKVDLKDYKYYAFTIGNSHILKGEYIKEEEVKEGTSIKVYS